MAAKSIPGFEAFENAWVDRAPLGWSLTDIEPAARTCLALMSDWFPATTGEIVHADGTHEALDSFPSFEIRVVRPRGNYAFRKLIERFEHSPSDGYSLIGY